MGLGRRIHTPGARRSAYGKRSARCLAAFAVVLGSVGFTAVLATSPASAAPTKLYVAQGGSDPSNTCTAPATPCATISHAVSQAASGDTILASGTIDDHVTIGTSIAGPTLTIAQWPKQAGAIVDGSNTGRPFAINHGRVTLKELTIEKGLDKSSQGGGGIAVLGGSVMIQNSTVTNSTAADTSGSCGGANVGGGVYNAGAMVMVTDSTIKHNCAASGGGIYNDSGGTLTVKDSTISGNMAMNNGGGGIWSVFGSSTTITNSTIAKNTAQAEGSAVFAGSRRGTFSLIDSTISGNTSTGGEGALNVGSTSTSHGVQVGATIVAANTGGNCGGVALPVSLGYNLTDDTTGAACGFVVPGDIANANPNLGSLRHNGGPTETMLPPTPSPERFVIPNPTTLGGTRVCPRTDQRGVDSPAGQNCTIGAVEAIPGDLYVAQGGGDTSNSCTMPASPCATVSRAVSQAAEGATILVSGTIDDHVQIGSSTSGMTLTIAHWPDRTPAVIDGTGSGRPFSIQSSTVTIKRLTIENGLGLAPGGGISIRNGNTVPSNVTLTHTTVMNNTVVFTTPGTCEDEGGQGGGIYNGATLNVKDSTISGNCGRLGGGIFNDTGGTLTLNDSTISGNKAPNGGSGGGIQTLSGSTSAITNSTIANNTAGVAGAILTSRSASFALLASTVSGNTTSNGFGGFITSGTSGATGVKVGATIVANNTGGNCGGLPPMSLGYNLTDDQTGTACGFTATGDVVNATPALGPLADNGGPTQTKLPPVLTPNPSPEAFVIPNPTTMAGTQVCPRIDQRGVPSPSGSACTIGAAEAIRGVAPSLPSGLAHSWLTGRSDSFTITATGTPAPTVTHPTGPSDGRLPNGLTISQKPGSAIISGTPLPNSGGTYPLVFVANNGVSPPSTQTVTVVVDQPPVMSLPHNGATVGFEAGVVSRVPWSITAPATTFPHVTKPLSVALSDPTGKLTLHNNDNGTGTVTGNLAKGTYNNISITASNAAGSSTTTFSIKAV